VGDFVNVGPDAELEARVKRMAGIHGDDADWPVVVWNGEVIGALTELEEFIAQKPPDDSSALVGPAVAEVVDWGRQERADSFSSEEPPLEASMNVLDMRLSVLGDQFHDTGLAHNKYPELEVSQLVEDKKSSSGKLVGNSGGVDPQSPLRTVDLALEGLEWAVLKVSLCYLFWFTFLKIIKYKGSKLVARFCHNSTCPRGRGVTSS
jgi:hypothetical protein